MSKHHISRRKFLGQASCAGLGMTTMLSTLNNLKLIGAATSHNTSLMMGGGNYKALVCILLSGGNDSYNLLVPTGSEYSEYSTTRSNLAVAENDLHPLAQTNVANRSFGLHPSMPHLANLFNNSTAAPKSGVEDANVAFISNVGSMIEPITKQEFYDGSKMTPLGLYSHADQIMHWQTAVPHDRVAQGWAGKVADLLAVGNNAYNEIGLNISMSGSNVFQTGDNTFEYAVNPFSDSGAVKISGYGDNNWIVHQMRTAKVNSMIEHTYQDIFKKGYVDMVKVGVEGQIKFEQAMNNTSPLSSTFTVHPDGYLGIGQSMQWIARMISANQQFGVDRQIFFLDFAGWDHHDDLGDQNDMLSWLDTSLYEFNNAMKEVGMQDCVTTFLMSEFGRTLTSNGQGSDHGWGGNVFAMGGAVNGKKIYGTYPSMVLDNPLEVGGGVYIPGTSCDEYFAELAMWFGVPNGDLSILYPNLPNFYSVGSGNPIGYLHI